MEITKLCYKCGKEKPINSDFFHKNRSTKSGYKSICKICTNAYNAQRYATIEEIRNKKAEKQRNNKEKVKQYLYKYLKKRRIKELNDLYKEGKLSKEKFDKKLKRVENCYKGDTSPP